MKLYAYLAAALLLAGVVGYGVHVVRKANRVDAAEARADAAEKRAVDVADSFARAAAANAGINAELEQFRSQLGAQSQSFHDALTRAPITREVPPHVDPKTGAVEPCRERDPVRYRELFNRAVTGSAGP